MAAAVHETATSTADLGEGAQVDVYVPSNDSMYALYMRLCGEHRIRKPNKFLLSLMPPDSNKVINGTDDLEEDAGESAVVAAAPPMPVPKFAALKTIDFTNVVLGNAGVLAFLELLREMPFFEVLDLSPLPDIFTHDALKSGPSGNSVVADTLCLVLRQHPSITNVNLRNHSVGTMALKALTEVLKANGNIIRIDYNPKPIEEAVVEAFEKQLALNNLGKNVKMPSFSRHPSPRIAQVEDCDRKTSDERQELHVLLYECRSTMGGILSSEEVNDLVLHATVLQLGETIQYCNRGLRGDDENLYLIASGELEAILGTQTAILARGDYFGEPIESAMYTGGRLTVRQRGRCFRIPFKYVRKIVNVWEERIEHILPLIKTAPLLQTVPVWVVMHCCHDAEVKQYRPEDAVITTGNAFSGLYLVCKGEFHVRIPDPSVRCGYREHDDVMFGNGDFFGEEAAVSRTPSSSVTIVAQEDTLRRRETAQCVLLQPRIATQHLIKPMKAALQLQAKLYSQQDMYIKK